MYTYERAIRDVGLQFNTVGDGAVGSAFRALEKRGASDAEWERVIDRIRAHASGAATDDYTVPEPGLSPALRQRLALLLS